MASGPDAAGLVTREAEAYVLFESLRWPGGPSACPHCAAAGGCRLVGAAAGVSRPTRTGRPSARRVWRCGRCRAQFSVLTGTVFERTRVSLSGWVQAVGVVSRSAQVTASELAAAVGVADDTARAMLYLMRAGLSAAQASPGAQPQG